MALVFYVGAFVDSSCSAWFSIGRKRKVDQVISMLSNLGFSITRLNIAPVRAPFSFDYQVALCTSACLPLRYVQIAARSFWYFLFSSRKTGAGIIWLYNTRAAESIVAVIGLLLRPDFRLVIQLEDLPSARLENHGFAGWIDQLATSVLSKRASHIFTVSQNVSDSLTQIVTLKANSSLLPPSLDPLFSNKAYYRQDPFISSQVSILYAGSYQPEKGVTDLLQAFARLDPNVFKLTLLGSSPKELVDFCRRNNAIEFKGIVDDEALFDAYMAADVVVNPHRPIFNSSYIFPFKLVEIVASGALPLTTHVPGSEIFGLPEICFFSDVDELHDRLVKSRQIWESNYLAVKAATADARFKFSRKFLQDSLAKSLGIYAT